MYIVEDGTPALRPTSHRSYFERDGDSDTRLLPENEFDLDESYVQSPTRHARTVSVTSCGEVGVGALSDNGLADISGKELLVNLDFWLLFSITSLRELLVIRHKASVDEF